MERIKCKSWTEGHRSGTTGILGVKKGVEVELQLVGKQGDNLGNHLGYVCKS